MAREVRVKAWCRVDFGGGTLDIWPLGLFHPQARTVNVAIDVAVEVRLTPGGGDYRVRQGEREVAAATAAELARDPDGALAGVIAVDFELPPFTAVVSSRSPRGGGLGASSALAVAWMAAAEEAFERQAGSAAERVHRARDLEARLMGLPTGIQDYYPALLGGALEIVPRAGGEIVRPLAVDLGALGDRLLLAYSGQSHFSAGNNWQVIRRRLEGDPEIRSLFDGIAAVAAQLPAALEAADWSATGHLMSEEWALRRQLAPEVSSPALERLVEAALAAGAFGGKACGAGGGGCLAFLVSPERRAAVAAALEKAGGEMLAARPTGDPLTFF
jgi:D-glycero-alpha-D-manno-heptose-7-phosphate kinase